MGSEVHLLFKYLEIVEDVFFFFFFFNCKKIVNFILNCKNIGT